MVPRRFTLIAFTVILLAARASAEEPIRLEADLREAPRGLIRAKLSIPAQPGPLTLYYPRWIPGEHGPSGPAIDLAGLKFSAGGRDLPWRRDLENMFALHLEVPPGATEVEARLEYLGPTEENFGYSAGPTTSAQLAVLNWNLVALYPAGRPAAAIEVEPSLILPAGWEFGTSLTPAGHRGNRVSFAPLTLEMLIDQPVIAGAHFSRIDLSPGAEPAHSLDCAADSEAALELSPERLQAYRRVPLEYGALMGIRYYETYHFLLALSDRTGYAGLEHHQCSDNRAPERALIDDDVFLGFANLLTHEYFHSWNGKHRRPQGLLSPDYQKPMRTDLLWVYEGLTQYYGNLMAARAGLWSGDDYDEFLAQTAALMSDQKGREWRPLQDTADAAQILYYAAKGWSSRRRDVDFYDEGVLIWLDADTLIRQRSGGVRSLDDFVRAFFGDGRKHWIDPRKVPGTRPSVVPYTADDIYAALGRVVPFDWKEFFTQRLNRVGPNPPMEGIGRAGWRLVFNHTQNRFVVSSEKSDKRVDLRYSLGLTMDAETQTIGDVIPGTAADQAGLGPNMKVIGVNGRKYSDDVMRDALIASERGKPIELLVENTEFITSHRLNYSGGLRYPHLERVIGTADLLGATIEPRSR